MRSEGEKVNLGWLSVVVGLVVFSVIGLRIDVQEGQFDMSGDHLLANVAWMITATIFVLMMTPGLSFFYGGMVRSKNVISTMLQSFIVMGFVSVIWVVFGFGLAFGDDVCHVIGNPSDFFMFRNVGVRNVTDPAGEFSQIGIVTTTIPLALFALFQMKFAIITPSLITGAFAERVHFTGYLLFMVLWTILVYCPLAHCTWHPEGLFGMLHVHDFAGGIVVHAASGIAALAGAMFLGKRRTSGNESSKPANAWSRVAVAWLVRIQRRKFACGRRHSCISFFEHQHGSCHRYGGVDSTRRAPRPQAFGHGCGHRCCGRSCRHNAVCWMGDGRGKHIHSLLHNRVLQYGRVLERIQPCA